MLRKLEICLTRPAILTNSVAGDIWLGTWQLCYKTNNGTLIYGAATNASNVFGSSQTIDMTHATLPGLRVTQRGSGHAFVVEDQNNPDTTATFISNAGLVYIGYNPASTTLPTGALLNIQGAVNFDQSANSHSNGFGLYNKEINVLVGGVTYAIPLRAI